MPSAQLYFHDRDGHALEFITLLDESPEPEFVRSLTEWKRRSHVGSSCPSKTNVLLQLFGNHSTPVSSVDSCFGGGAAATDPKRRPGFQTSTRGAALLRICG